MGSIYVICSRQCPNGDGIYTLLYALYKYSTSITNQPTNPRKLALANASENLARRVENRPGRVEFCIGYRYKRLPISGEYQKILVSQPAYDTFGGLFWSPTGLWQAARSARICEAHLILKKPLWLRGPTTACGEGCARRLWNSLPCYGVLGCKHCRRKLVYPHPIYCLLHISVRPGGIFVRGLLVDQGPISQMNFPSWFKFNGNFILLY